MRFILLLILFSLSTHAQLLGNRKIGTFETAKKHANEIFSFNPVTVYCPCKYSGEKVDLDGCGYDIYKDPERAYRLEWEHIVPAENFGESFAEWRTPCFNSNGKKLPRRKCAEKNDDFKHMEADLYNLWPISGELNNMRSNLSFGEIGDSDQFITFGKCAARVSKNTRRFMPMNEYKGIVARTYFYMDASYPKHGILSDQRRKLFEAWDKKYPVSDWECQRNDLIEEIQGNENTFVKKACEGRAPSAVKKQKSPQ